MKTLSLEALKELHTSLITDLHYNKETGVFSISKSGTNSKLLNQRIDNRGYVRLNFQGKPYQAHRLAFLYVNGAFPDDEVDHLDGNRSNNAWSNIRRISHGDNQKNLTMNTRNKTGINGIMYTKNGKGFVAQIGNNGVTQYLGSFGNINDAIRARVTAEIKLNYHDDHGKRKVKLYRYHGDNNIGAALYNAAIA